MPRQATKRKPAAPQWSQRQKVVEEFAALDREVENLKPKLSRHEKLRTLILDWYPDLPAEEEITAPGITCDILISSRDRVRSVTPEGKQKLFKLWGPRGFIAKCHVHLKSLPDPKDEASLYTVQALTGPRHLHIVERAEAASNAA